MSDVSHDNTLFEESTDKRFAAHDEKLASLAEENRALAEQLANERGSVRGSLRTPGAEGMNVLLYRRHYKPTLRRIEASPLRSGTQLIVSSEVARRSFLTRWPARSRA